MVLGKRRQRNRYQREGIAQATLVSDDRAEKFGQRVDRKGKCECASVPRLAGNPDFAAVQMHEFFGDIQPQTQAFAVVVHCIRVLVQPLENQGFGFRADAPPAIARPL